jgi:nucleotide-binding universal stress UspA family protein
VTGVTVSTPFHFIALEPRMTTDTLESYTAQMSTVAAQRLDPVKNAASVAGLECDVVHARHEHPYQAIIDTAVNRGCDLIVMASHGRSGIAAIVLGSETVKVLTHCTIPVLVYRQPRAKEVFTAS